MHRSLATLVALALVLAAGVAPAGAAGTAGAAGQECSFPVTETDATDTEVTIDGEPERIVTLSPSAAQTLWEIGAREKVVGVSQYATYLEGAGERTNVSAGPQSFDIEQIVSLDPDLVLAPNVIPDQTVQQLRDAGVTVFKFEAAASIDDISTKTELTGRLVGECAGASETVAWMDEELATVEEAVAGEERPRVLYTAGGWTAGNGTFIHEILTTAGGSNVAAAANVSGYAQISGEQVVEHDPQWLVLESNLPSVPDSAAYEETTAVRENQTIVLNSNYLSQPAPRVVSAIVTLAQTLHPEAYAAANETTATETTTTATTPPLCSEVTTTTPADCRYPPERTETTETTETATSGQPGFTAGLALAALAAVALARRD